MRRVEVTITLGATEAIFSAILALAGPGDEVHRVRSRLRFLRSGRAPGRRAAVCTCRCCRPRSATTGTACAPPSRPHAACVVINSPHNPACTVMSRRRPRPAGRHRVEATTSWCSATRSTSTSSIAPARHHSVPAAPALRRQCAGGVFVRQVAACDGSARGLLRGAARTDHGTAQGAPVQYLHASPRHSSMRSPPIWPRTPDAFSRLPRILRSASGRC